MEMEGEDIQIQNKLTNTRTTRHLIHRRKKSPDFYRNFGITIQDARTPELKREY